MSSSATDPTDTKTANTTDAVMSPKDKGKSKAKADVSMDEDEEGDEEEEEGSEEEEEGSEEEDDDDDVEENLDGIHPSDILPPGRRTRGVKVDYTSKEALEKAGLQGNEKDEDSDDDVEMKD